MLDRIVQGTSGKVPHAPRAAGVDALPSVTDRSRVVVIVGFMGAGKTTAAHALAAARGERPIKVSGELEERRALELLAAKDSSVLSLDAGALGSAAVREALCDHSVVWIDIDPETAWERCQARRKPVAIDRDRFSALHAKYEPAYAAAADIVIPHTCAERIVSVLEEIEGLPQGVLTLWATSDTTDYPVYIGPGLLGGNSGADDSHSAFWPATVTGRRFLVTDDEAGRLFSGRVGHVDGQVTINSGEQSKNIAHAEVVWSELARAAMTRADVVVALGGGVVGDLAGFCAATYQRGVRCVQMPTTLVAQVDSAYGGKTAVDLAVAKNYIGSFHQPRAVIADTDALATLPQEEIGAGYAEMIKTALLAGGWLWDRVRAGGSLTDPALISACAWIKLKLVARDTFDCSVRQTLNLGHTVGHAIETATNYTAYRHGEAVGLGLLAALRLSGAEDLRAEVKGLLASHGLPTAIEGVAAETVVAATALDKKRVNDDGVPFVLLERPGHARHGQILTLDEILPAVEELV